MFTMGPNDDLRSWAMRLAHFGVLGGIFGLILAILLVIQNFYLMFAFIRLRSQVNAIQRTLDNALRGIE